MFSRRGGDAKKGGGAAIASQARNMAKKLVFTHAVPVDLFLYNAETSSYKTVGRIGAGILGNKLVRQFNIIFYYTPQKNEVYVNFTDDKRQQWSVQFASADALQVFLQHYAVARICLDPSKTFTIDLVTGSGKPLSAGDVAGVAYTLNQEQDAKVAAKVEAKGDSKKPHRVTVGQSTLVKAFDDTLVGMSKGSKRILAVPAALAYGNKGSTLRNIPADTSLVFVVELLRLKHMGGASSTKSEAKSTASTQTSGGLGSLFSGASSASLFGSTEGPADLPSMGGSLSLLPKDPPKAEAPPAEEQPKEAAPKKKSSVFDDDGRELFSKKEAKEEAPEVHIQTTAPAPTPAQAQQQLAQHQQQQQRHQQQAPLAVYNPLQQQNAYSASAPNVAFQDATVQSKMDEIYQLRKQLNEVRDAKLAVEEERFAAKEQLSQSKRKMLQMEIQIQDLQEELEAAKRARAAPPPQAATNLEHLEALKQNHKHELQEQRLKLKEQHEQDMHTALHQQKSKLKKQFAEELADKEKQAAAAYQMGMKKGKQGSSATKEAGLLDEEAELETTRTIIKSVKGVMSNVFVSVKDSIDVEETYGGAEVIAKLVESLRSSTFEAVKRLEEEARERQAARELEEQELAELDDVLSDLSIDDEDLENISDFELSDEDI